MKDDAELFKQFSGNEGCCRCLTGAIFDVT